MKIIDTDMDRHGDVVDVHELSPLQQGMLFHAVRPLWLVAHCSHPEPFGHRADQRRAPGQLREPRRDYCAAIAKRSRISALVARVGLAGKCHTPFRGVWGPYHAYRLSFRFQRKSSGLRN
jgi:hypothetical protein